MIRPLRRRHRATMLVLAVLLPSLYMLAMRVRRPMPLVNAIVESTDRVGRLDGVPRDLDVAWDGLEVETRVWSEGTVLELEPVEDPARPDVLVYWSTGDGDSPGDGSHLLGPLAGDESRRYALPSEALSEGGRLLLWSTGHAELVASAELPPTGGAR